MKKILIFILLLCMALTLAACTDNENTPPEDTTPQGTTPEDTTPEDTTPEITLQEVYDAGKNLSALLGDHETVYIQIISDGTVIREEYFSKQYGYSFFGAEYMDIGFDYASFVTDHSEYLCFDNTYAFNVMLTPSGIVGLKDRFATFGTNDFVSSEMLNDDSAAILEKDGAIIVTCTADPDEILIVGEDVVSCVETYTLDAKTREMTSIKTVYTYKDGTIEEGIVTITRDVEAPEGAQPFLAYEQEIEDWRTVTIVSNPGTESEKTESVRVAKGLPISFSPDWDVEKAFALYADADCTQAIEDLPDVHSDATVYIKWEEWIPEDEIRYTVTAEEWEELVHEKNFTWERIENGETQTIQKFTEYAISIDGDVILLIDDKQYSLVESEEGWLAYDCTFMQFDHPGLLETFDMIDFEYDESKQAYLYKYWEEYGYKLELRFENGIQTSLTIIDVEDESNVSVRLVHDVGTTVIEIPEDFTIVEEDDDPVPSPVTEEEWNSFVGETNFEYVIMMSDFDDSAPYSESHVVKSVGNAISIDDVIYVLEDGKYYVLEETTGGWIATESKLPAFCFASLLEGLRYNDFEFSEESGYYVPKETVENEPYSELYFDENGVLLVLFIYNANLSENPEAEGLILATVIGFSNIGTTVIDIPEYTVVKN